MPAYRITINDRIYEGVYGSRSNAVYGAMLKDEGEIQIIVKAENPSPTHVRGCECLLPGRWRCTCGMLRLYQAACARRRGTLAPHTIHVAEAGRTTKKIHRVA